MKELIIRKFEHTDVDAFIRISQSSFAEESIAAGITPEDFELETRRIFRWKMIPYRLLTMLMGVKWEAFVAEKDGVVVGGGMYIGQKDHMTLTNLMVDPQYRRQGIGQALLVKRLERLTERGFPYVTTQVLETNTASLQNLRKQNFEVYNQYSVYEHDLPLTTRNDPALAIREVNSSDRVLFRNMEKTITSPFALFVNGSAESQYFPSGWQKLFTRFTGYSRWIKALVVEGETIGFLGASYHRRQSKGSLLQPILPNKHLAHLPAMIQAAGSWLADTGKASMILEISDQRSEVRDYLLGNGWRKTYTWLELIKWLDEQARPNI